MSSGSETLRPEFCVLMLPRSDIRIPSSKGGNDD